MNADGVLDVVCGAIHADTNGVDSGHVYVLSGATGVVIRSYAGDAFDQRWGHGVSAAGDLNGDLYADTFVVSNDRNGAPSEGRVYSGIDGAILLQFFGNGSDGFGHACGNAGDVNGDGVTDFLVGLPADGTVATGAGAARVYSGVDGSEIATWYGEQTQERFGYSVDGIGDSNLDGFTDMVIGTSFQGGAPGYSKVMSALAAESYGVLQGQQALSLAWAPGVPGFVHQGALVLSGGTPAGLGVVAVSLLITDGSTMVGSQSIFVDVNPAVSFVAPAFFDGAGVLGYPLDLRIPGLAGLSLFTQAFEADAAVFGGLLSSNAVKLLFGN